jgi:altronate dehydratase
MSEGTTSVESAWDAVMIDSRDNIAIALGDLQGKVSVRDGDRQFSIVLGEAIPMGHKLAVSLITAGDAVLKYGHSMGIATKTIPAGMHVHVHNVASERAMSRSVK